VGFFSNLFGPRVAPLPESREPADVEALSIPAYFAEASSWVPVSSSNVHSIAYYRAEEVLGVRFLRKPVDGSAGSEYRLSGVPVGVWAGFLNAGSHGVYYWQHLRDKYVTVKIW
jgi:hypothetical protein